jgi:hypothetical protein
MALILHLFNVISFFSEPIPLLNQQDRLYLKKQGQALA